MVNARLQPEKLLSIYRKISEKVFQEHKPKQSGCSFSILSKWDVHNIQIDFRRYLLNASQNEALMTCTCVLLSPVFFIVIPFIYIYLFKTNKLSRDYLIFLYRPQLLAIKRHRKSFVRLMKIWAVNSFTRDRSIFLLCSNRTEELS